MTSTKNSIGRTVYIVDGSRTPFLKARGKPGLFSAADLAVSTCQSLLLRQPFLPNDLDSVVTGCVMPSEKEANISRIISLRIGCGFSVPAYTVQRNCASGLQAVDSAAQDIASGRYDLMLAGGTEAMSRAPLLFPPSMATWLSQFQTAKTWTARLKQLTQFRLSYLRPIIALLHGLSDPLVKLSMGQTAENIAYRFGITREAMDQFAFESHQRLARAYDQHEMSEITPLYDEQGKVYTEDDGLRRDTTLEKLATLKPFFDKPFGTVTAANSSQVTDGAAFLLLASADAVRRYQLPVIAKIIDIQWGALDPAEMGLGPVHAVVPLLQRHHLQLNDIDYWEMNEAFAAQVLACLSAFESDEYCRTNFGLPHALGQIDRARLNVDGGGIAIGHPVGASGARVLLHLIHVLHRKSAKRGIATLCIGGGQGGAILIERTNEVSE